MEEVIELKVHKGIMNKSNRTNRSYSIPEPKNGTWTVKTTNKVQPSPPPRKTVVIQKKEANKALQLLGNRFDEN